MNKLKINLIELKEELSKLDWLTGWLTEVSEQEHVATSPTLSEGCRSLMSKHQG